MKIENWAWPTQNLAEKKDKERDFYFILFLIQLKNIHAPKA